MTDNGSTGGDMCWPKYNLMHFNKIIILSYSLSGVMKSDQMDFEYFDIFYAPKIY